MFNRTVKRTKWSAQKVGGRIWIGKDQGGSCGTPKWYSRVVVGGTQLVEEGGEVLEQMAVGRRDPAVQHATEASGHLFEHFIAAVVVPLQS